MANLTSYTKALTGAQAVKLRGILVEQGFEFQTKEWCIFAGTRPGVNVLVYEKGPKVVVQGKGTEEFVLNTLEPLVLEKAELGYEEVLNPEMFAPHIGVDESGKGDFLGPLVIAGAYVDAEMARKLQAMGVMDSKRIGSDARIASLAAEMRRVPGFVSEMIVIGPERYNEMYLQFGNLNKLLAWGHAKIIELLLEKVPGCPRALSDQFANPRVLQKALQTRGRQIELVQRTKAESDPAVAAASILAREKFVSWLADKGREIGVELPKGASPAVKDAARRVYENGGEDALKRVAKMHFKTAGEVCVSA